MSPTQPMGRREWALMLLLALLWGSSFYFYKLMAGQMGPFTVVLGRMGISAAIMHAILAARGERLPPLRQWGPYFVLALLNCVIPFACFAWSERHISSGMASIINAMTPIFTVLVAHWWTHNEKLSPNKILGIGFGFAGVALLIGPSALAGGQSLFGEIACLLATVCYGFGGVYSRRFSGQSLYVTVTMQMTAATLLAAPLCALIDPPWLAPMPDAAALWAVAGIAVICSVVAYLLFFHILNKAGATNISLVTFLIPISAVFLGVILLGESVSANAILGMFVIGLGLAAIDGRPLAWLRASGARALRV